MFPLHDRTRRKLAIAGFVFLCLVPTCTVATWCLWRNLPWETRLAAEKLQQQLGWKVKLERLRHPRPCTDVYEKLELLDPETDRTVFSCQSVSVEIRLIAISQGQYKPMLAFEFDRPAIEAETIPQVHRLLERALQDQVASGMNCYFTAAELQVHRGETKQTYRNVVAGVDHVAKFVNAPLRFYLPDRAAAPITLRLTRDRNAAPPRNHFESDAAENEVPREMLALMGGVKLE
jgi:hypothetical protein